MKKVSASFLTAWAPSLGDDKTAWKEWLQGRREIPQASDSPSLDFMPPLFRRRLSQLTKMTVHTVHRVIEESKKTELKIFSAGNYGEINREFQINEQLVNDHDILPATFSLSVFNTPAAQATLACKIHSGYTAAFGAEGSFYDALAAAASIVLCGDEKEILFTWGDENLPEEYTEHNGEKSVPLCFSFILSSEETENSFSFDADTFKDSKAEDFLRKFINENY
ncbi:MAG: beta-ketoacyl synthase chain length factor [Treponema sp.]|nr:beta-ketoacyl synthase chain length factor [Treponema sp.]